MKYRVVFNGVVQGVGCRAIVRAVAKGMHLGGITRNLESGGVEAYIEAPAGKVAEKLVEEVKRASENTAIEIMKTTIYTEDDNEFYLSKPPSDYSSFRIV